MAIVRRLTNNEMKEAVRLADETFRDAEQPSMGEAFPLIFSEAEAHQSYAAFQDDGKLIAFMGLVPWQIKVGDARLNVFSLGSVCTAPEARGQGVASEILQEIYHHIRQAGASLLLVSGSRSLYTRTGCMPFGRVRIFSLHPAAAETIAAAGHGSTARIREMTPADLFALQQVASNRQVCYEFSVRDLMVTIKAEAYASVARMTHRVLVAEEDGVVSAFAVIGVPRDPQKRGRIIEQAGDPATVVRLAGEAVVRYRLPGLDFPVLWHEQGLAERLAGFGISYDEGKSSGTIRVVDGETLIAQLRPWLDSRAAGSAETLSLTQTEEGGWLLGHGQAAPVALDAAELVRLVFDCADDDPSSLPAGAEAFRDLFPVPFPYPVGLGYV